MKLSNQAVQAFKDYVRATNGRIPNRVLMNSGDTERFKNEILISCLYETPHPLVNQAIIFHGMRLVTDDNADGIEVAYAR